MSKELTHRIVIYYVIEDGEILYRKTIPVNYDNSDPASNDTFGNITNDVSTNDVSTNDVSTNDVSTNDVDKNYGNLTHKLVINYEIREGKIKYRYTLPVDYRQADELSNDFYYTILKSIKKGDIDRVF